MSKTHERKGRLAMSKEKILGLRVVVWGILYLFEHTGEDFQSEVFLVT